MGDHADSFVFDSGWLRNSTGQIIGPGIDNYEVTSNGFYIGTAFVLGVGWLIVAYFAL